MGNPYLRKRSAKSVSLRPLYRRPGNDMSVLPVPITTLDGGEQETTSLSATLRHQFPHVLLVECMLERLCSVYEADQDKQKELYKAIRQYFIRFRLLPPYAGFPEMDGVRLRLGSDLNNLFRLAKLEMATSRHTHNTVNSLVPARPSPLSGSIWSVGDGSEHFFTSRYELDFKEMEFIAAGGFGVVYKALNILDNNQYAIKKIIIGPRSANKILREVHLLSQLHHLNIVAYKSAWLEYCPPHTMHRILQHMEGLNSSTLNESSSSFTLDSAYSRGYRTVYSSQRVVSSSNSSSVVFESEETSTETSRIQTSQSREVSTRNQSIALSNTWRLNRSISSPVMLLYIQMQLCPQTLRHWLNSRNGLDTELHSIDLELSIFRQIVEGIHYIHSTNIIHRDVKPENIFVDASASQVLIGDFGLAVHRFRNEHNGTALATNGTGGTRATTRGVGTHAYAAPEQLANEEPDAKSDIYSLGIVLLELLHPFKTVMERYKTIEKLRSHSELPENVRVCWPELATLMLQMVSRDRVLRPSATDIKICLESYRSSVEKNTATSSSKFSTAELLSIIEDLKRQLKEKDLVIENLTKTK